MGALGLRERGHGMVGVGDSGERHDEHCGVRLMMEFWTRLAATTE
jgi:hypothetical protein